MKKLLILFLFLYFQNNFGQFNYQRAWATYFFGSSSEIKDSKIDNDGNVIILGKLKPRLNDSFYSNFTTPNTFQPNITNYNNFVYFLAKFGPNGNLIWGTYLQNFPLQTSNGINFYGFEIDSNNNIYLYGGSSFSSGIATTNTFMPVKPLINEFNSTLKFGNGGFLMKFDNTGNKVWGTYFPGNINSLAIDNNDNLIFTGLTTYSYNIATTGVYQENIISHLPNQPAFENLNYFIAKFDTTGNRISGSYLGKSNRYVLTNHVWNIKIKIDNQNNYLVSLIINPEINNTLTTPNCYQIIRGGQDDIVLMKISSDLSQKYWGTYFGGANVEILNNIEVVGTDIYLVGSGSSGLGTPGVFQENTPYSNSNPLITKFNTDGNKEWCTYFYDATSINDIKLLNNKLLIYGTVFNPTINFSTTGSYQTTRGGGWDNFFSEFNLDGSRNWTSYYGGENFEDQSDTFFKFDKLHVHNNEFYLLGDTNSTTGIATTGSFQENLLFSPTSTNTGFNNNIFIAKFEPISLSDKTFNKNNYQLSPNPNNGSFTFTGNFNEDATLILYDNLGREFISRKIENNRSSQTFNLENELKSGVYFAKLVNENGLLQTFKVLVKP